MRQAPTDKLFVPTQRQTNVGIAGNDLKEDGKDIEGGFFWISESGSFTDANTEDAYQAAVSIVMEYQVHAYR